MKTSVSSKGQIVLPAELREQDSIRPGEQFDVERLGSGQYLLSKLTTPGNVSVLDWLRACPEKDWFQPLPAASTDEIGTDSSPE
jgi:AbrB family looped-hinge helix DNA binding protein